MALIIMGSANAKLIKKGKQKLEQLTQMAKNVLSNKRLDLVANKKRLDLVAELQKERETYQSAWADKKDEYRHKLDKKDEDRRQLDEEYRRQLDKKDEDRSQLDKAYRRQRDSHEAVHKVEMDLSGLETKIEKLNIEITKGLFDNAKNLNIEMIKGLFDNAKKKDWLGQLQKENDLCQIELKFQQDELDRQKEELRKPQNWKMFQSRKMFHNPQKDHRDQEEKIKAKIKKLEEGESPKLKSHMEKLNTEMAKLKN